MRTLGLRTVIGVTLFLLAESNLVSRWNKRRPDDSIFLIFYELSYKECFDACIRFRLCGVFDYNRRLQKCRLSHRHGSIDYKSTIETGSVITKKPTGAYDNYSSVPVFDVTQLPDCNQFTRNLDEVTLECKTSSGDKKIYVQLPNGQVVDHVTVFRAFTGDGIDTYDSWINRQNVTFLRTCVSPDTCNKHYRHILVDELGPNNVKQVKYILKKDEREVAFILFKGQGHDLESWFTFDGILNTSWEGLTTIASFNYFSVKGHDPGRRFQISVSYDGCPNDEMVTFVTTNKQFQCPFDSVTKAPQFSYCENVVPCLGEDLKIADVLEIEWYF